MIKKLLALCCIFGIHANSPDLGAVLTAPSLTTSFGSPISVLAAIVAGVIFYMIRENRKKSSETNAWKEKATCVLKSLGLFIF